MIKAQATDRNKPAYLRFVGQHLSEEQYFEKHHAGNLGLDLPDQPPLISHVADGGQRLPKWGKPEWAELITPAIDRLCLG